MPSLLPESKLDLRGLRVLYVSHFGELGGAERSLLELLIEVKRLGIEAALICPAGVLAREAERARVEVVRWQAHVLERYPGVTDILALLRAWLDLKRCVKRFGPHVIHANNFQSLVWMGPVAACGLPVVWQWRDFYSYPRLARLLARRVHTVVAISPAIKEFAAMQLEPNAPRIVLVNNGLADLPESSPSEIAEVRCSLGLLDNTRLVVVAGQSIPRKGHAVFLEAVARLAKVRSDFHALLICDELSAEHSAHTSTLRGLAGCLGCERLVTIRGGTSQLAPFLRAANVVAVPSIREPFGRVAVEAMLAQRPVVASAVDGLKGIVVDGETGVFVKPGDSQDLASGIAAVLDNVDAWTERCAKSRVRALKVFSASRVADDMLSIYRTVVQSSGCRL